MNTQTLSLLERCKTALIELPFDSSTLIEDLEAAIAAERNNGQASVGTIGHIGDGKATLTAAILPLLTEQATGAHTGNTQADAALVMLDRLDVSEDDDVRVDAISKIIRELVKVTGNTYQAGYDAANHMAQKHIRQLNKELDTVLSAYRKLNAAIAAGRSNPQAQSQEPVGYWCREFKDGAAVLYEVSQESCFGILYTNEPLYASPQPLKPLSDGDIDLLWRKHSDKWGYVTSEQCNEITRAIEAKLGVGK